MNVSEKILKVVDKVLDKKMSRSRLRSTTSLCQCYLGTSLGTDVERLGLGTEGLVSCLGLARKHLGLSLIFTVLLLH